MILQLYVGELGNDNTVKPKSDSEKFFDLKVHNLDDLITEKYNEKQKMNLTKAFSGKI